MKPLDPSDVETCLRVLKAIHDDRGSLAAVDEQLRHALVIAAGRVGRPARSEVKRLTKALKRRERQQVRAHDVALLSAALTRTAQRASAFVLPEARTEEDSFVAELKQPRRCYVCKEKYTKVHHFYHALCPDCAALNYQKRFQKSDMTGRVVLVTGARIKIGYQASLMMLRAGAQVIATTRFVTDAALRYAREPDFEAFRDRLTLQPLDLRYVPNVELFARDLCAKLPKLDVLIHNAAQTVSRPREFYQHLIDTESQPLDALPEAVRPLLAPARQTEQALTVRPGEALAYASEHAWAFPPGEYDADDQQLDLRRMNSWRMTLADVPTVELVEVHLVNAIAPCLLTARLKPLMLRTPERDKHIVNVSAMEAQFSRNKKTDKHPHTNMAKAALNMMTRTSAVDYVRDGIHMNSVDTGWVTDEDPLHHVARKQRVHDFHPPLDAVDGAARVCDPVFLGLSSGNHPWGLFLKDYKAVPW
jgi:NAD(P)-dependent dehydrogenase (short-subunit alcohol dehydrogenase family)